MTRDDIIRMAREACDADKVDAWHNGFWTLTQEELEKFAALVRQHTKIEQMPKFEELAGAAREAEREACAKVCDEEAAGYQQMMAGCSDARYDWKVDGCMDCAAAIRART